MVDAYVLIKTAVGKVSKVSGALCRVKGVKSVCAVTGPFDLIAFVEAKDVADLGKMITTKFHKIKGIESTETAIVT
ncbi:MAG: Lrp/AsnC ligand binding domain-containing protein [Nitrososphaerota archaeon]